MSIALFYMFLTALFATLLYVILKYFQVFKVNTFQGLTFNYLTAAATAFLLNSQQSIDALPSLNEIVLPAAIIGLMFITVFYTAALTASVSGVGITSLIAKMSMVIPVTAGFFLYNEEMTIMKIIGILIALLAVYLANQSNEKKAGKQMYLLPLLLFLGSGLVDAAVKFAQHHFINDSNRQLYICSMYAAAGCFGLLMIIFKLLLKKDSFDWKSVFAGVILGVINYFSLDFLIRSLAGADSAIVFSIVNMMVVILSALFGIILFQEKMNGSKATGIGLALIAILALSW